ncbi:transcriptional regulator [Streptomyces sp. NPDC059382]|uniref:transcriptional regulator n=1 Tax=Streptomyces sp. NPDC059382 TaxID=3346816 RepID=UPI00369B798A
MLAGPARPFLSMPESGARRLTDVDRIITLLDGLGVPIEPTGPVPRTSARPVSPREPSGLPVVAPIGAD